VVAISHPLDNATPHATRWRTLCPAEALPNVLRRERARADRIRSGFCVVLVGLRGGQEDADAVAKLGDLVATRARETDEVAVVGGRFVCAVLPDTPLGGARRFVDAVRASLNGQAGRTVFEVLRYPSSPEEAATEGAAQRPPSLGDRPKGHERSLDDDGDGASIGHGDDRGAVPNPPVSGSGGSETAPPLSAFVRHVASPPLSRSSSSGSGPKCHADGDRYPRHQGISSQEFATARPSLTTCTNRASGNTAASRPARGKPVNL